MKPGGSGDGTIEKTGRVMYQDSNTRGSNFNSVFESRSFNRDEFGDDGTRGIGLKQGRSIGRTSSTGSSCRRNSLSFSRGVGSQVEDDIESETVSEAGDIGDRALHSHRYSESGRIRLSVDNVIENTDTPIAEDSLLQSSNTMSLVLSLPLEIKSPLSPDAILNSRDKNQSRSMHVSGQTGKDNQKELPQAFHYISCLTHLAVFGILGVLTRYLLEKLFGPGGVGVTSDLSILYVDLPSNMVGSFLMGWFGVVFKGDISSVSDLLAIGLTTGYLGSLTTFSNWNQKMLELSVKDHWVLSVLGFLIGMFLAAYSIIFGVETANGFRWLLKRLGPSSKSSMPSSSSNWRVDSYKRHLAVMVVLVLMLGLLWGVSGALVKSQFNSSSSNAELWLACVVAPFGVWVRWFLARLNGRGLGRQGLMKWVPFGTLLANVSAACVMAALATVKNVVDTKRCETIATGIQFGLLGCLSTVSTFMAEFHAMRVSKHPWRAYVYAMITITASFGLGTLIYSVPVWTKVFE